MQSTNLQKTRIKTWTLNSTVETLQSQVTGLRSVVRQQSEKITTLSKPHSSPIPPRSNNNFQTYPYSTPFHNNKRYRSRSPINSSTKKPRNRTPVSSPRITSIRTPRKKTVEVLFEFEHYEYILL